MLALMQTIHPVIVSIPKELVTRTQTMMALAYTRQQYYITSRPHSQSLCYSPPLLEKLLLKSCNERINKDTQLFGISNETFWILLIQTYAQKQPSTELHALKLLKQNGCNWWNSDTSIAVAGDGYLPCLHTRDFLSFGENAIRTQTVMDNGAGILLRR
jgi:hypothetical protein